MPELPEVEITVRGLEKTVLGLVIQDVWTDLSTTDKRKTDAVANPIFFKSFKRKVKNAKIISVERRAKNILINLNNEKTILIHLKMTGHLLYGKYKFIKKENKWKPDEDERSPLHDPFNRFVHVVFTLSNGKHLAFSDTRKFGKITLLDSKTTHETKHLLGIGPEPLDRDFTQEKMKERLLKKPNGKIKTVLMDQTVIAGIGNIYSDEILWRSNIHPERKVSNVQEKEIALIYKEIKETLTKGIDFGGDSMSDYRNIHGLKGEFQLHHEAYRRTHEKCRKKNPRQGGASCNGIITRKVINGRSAHFCNMHQK